MDIKFKELHIKNFMSIGDAHINLSDCGFTLIEGINNNDSDNARSNGAGKSSIFEALVWALTGNTMRGNKDVVNYNGDDGALVKVLFTVDKDTFLITRTKEHSKYKTNLLIEINGVDKSGKGIRDSEKLLAEYLPDLTSSLIGSVIVLGQGLPQKFSSNSPSGRKEVLERLFKSDYMIQDLKNRVANRRAELLGEIRQVQDKKLINVTKIDTLTDRVNIDKARHSQLQEMSNLEDTNNALLLEVEELQTTFNNIRENMESYENDRLEKLNKASQCKVQRAEVIANIDKEYESTIKYVTDNINACKVKYNLAIAERDRVINIKEVCPTCGQRLPEVHKPDLTPYSKAVDEARASLEHWNQQNLELIEEINNKKALATEELSVSVAMYESEAKHLYGSIQLLIKQHTLTKNALEEKRKALEENTILQRNRLFEMESLMRSIEDNLNTIDSLTNCNAELDEQERILNDRLSIENKFNTAITRDFRGHLLSDIIVYINRQAKSYCKEVFGTELIEFTLDGNNLIISYNDKEYESLSGGERQKVDLIIQFAIRDMLCHSTSFSSNIIVLDEIFDNLDDLGCQKVLDLITKHLYDISSIFIITHHGNELNIPYDNIIKIVKDNNGITRLCN